MKKILSQAVAIGILLVAIRTEAKPKLGSSQQTNTGSSSDFHINVVSGYGVHFDSANSTNATVAEKKERPLAPARSYQFFQKEIKKAENASVVSNVVDQASEETVVHKSNVNHGSRNVVGQSQQSQPRPFTDGRPSEQVIIGHHYQEQYKQQQQQQKQQQQQHHRHQQKQNQNQQLQAFAESAQAHQSFTSHPHSSESYQVHEPTPERLQDKAQYTPNSFPNPQHSFVHTKARPSLNELNDVVNNLEYSGPTKSNQIVEVVKVPAIYELHVQPNMGAQRYVMLNPIGYIRGAPEKQKPWQQRTEDNFGKHTQILGEPQINEMLRHLMQQHPSDHVAQDFAEYVPPTKTIPVRHNFRPEGNMNSHTTQNQWKYQNNQVDEHQSNIADLYRKPQAIHEVPAPSLNGYRVSSRPRQIVSIPPSVSHGPLSPQVQTLSSSVPTQHYDIPQYHQATSPTSPNSIYEESGETPSHQLLYQSDQQPQISAQIAVIPGMIQQAYPLGPLDAIQMKPVVAYDDYQYQNPQQAYSSESPEESIPEPLALSQDAMSAVQPTAYVDQNYYTMDSELGNYLQLNQMVSTAEYPSAPAQDGNNMMYQNFAYEQSAVPQPQQEQVRPGQYEMFPPKYRTKGQYHPMVLNKKPQSFKRAPMTRPMMKNNPDSSSYQNFPYFESMKLMKMLHRDNMAMQTRPRGASPRPFTANRRSSHRPVFPMDYVIYIKDTRMR